MSNDKDTAPIFYKKGCCQNPGCDVCVGLTLPSLPRGYMLSHGNIVRDLNHDLPADTAKEWTEHEQQIFKAIQTELGCGRMEAIRSYRRGDKVSKRRLCADTSGEDFHFLPENARANQTYCGSACRKYDSAA